jgi:hypothetical protein
MKKLILGFAFLLAAIPCEARIITVDDDGPADFKIIQAAIDYCNDGDTVLIYPGTYYENLSVRSKSITLTSIDPADPNVVAATIIDGNSLGTVVSIIDVNGADANAVIAGLTVTNGLAKAGGGIYCENSIIKISNCVISANRTNDGEYGEYGQDVNTIDGGFGAGIYATYSSVTIANCSVNGNITGKGAESWWPDVPGGNGGGIYSSSSAITITNTKIMGNKTGDAGNCSDYGSGGSGGGIYCEGCSPLIVKNCIISNNTAGNGIWPWQRGGNGGGIYSTAPVSAIGCTISNNTTGDSGPSLEWWGDASNGGSGGGIYCEASLSITYCNLIDNRTGYGGDSWGGDVGNGGSGGGIYCEVLVSITDCNLSGNRTGAGGNADLECSGNGGDGGAILCSSVIAIDCTIKDNRTGPGGWTNDSPCTGNGGNGAGIYCSGATIANCIFSNNQTGDGGYGSESIPGDGGSGAGIYCGPSPTNLTNCLFINNTTGWGGEGYVEGGNGGSGAGICSFSILTIHNCHFIGNQTGSGGWCFYEGDGGDGGNGGGIFSTSPSTTIVQCEIMSNSTGEGGDGGYYAGAGNGGNGAGIYCSSATIIDCTISNNTTGPGGNGWTDPPDFCTPGGNGGDGSGIFGPSASITNCTIVNNTTGPGGKGGKGEGCSADDGSIGLGAGVYANVNTVVLNSILWGNSPDELAGQDCNNVAYCDGICGSVNGNISTDPLFADPNKGDYHLKSQAGRWDPNSQSWVLDDVTSPCIDAGDPNSDWTAELWPHGKRTNMGAYGGTPEASMSLSNVGNVADLNHDEKVDFEDFALLAECWAVKQVLLAEDLDLDGQVDTNDIYVFAENWLWDKQGLVGYWKFDDGNGTVAYDSSGYGNTGVFVSGPVWTSGKFDGGLRFDGIDDAVEIKTDRLDPNAGSISLWAYPETFSSMPHYLFGHTGSFKWSSRIQLYISDPNGNLALGLGDVHFRHTGIEKLDLNRWYHIALTWNGKAYEVYVNGVLKASGNYTGLSQLSAFADIGNDGNPVYRDESFCGIIDEVRIYSRVLTPIEVLYLFNE